MSRRALCLERSVWHCAHPGWLIAPWQWNEWIRRHGTQRKTLSRPGANCFAPRNFTLPKSDADREWQNTNPFLCRFFFHPRLICAEWGQALPVSSYWFSAALPFSNKVPLGKSPIFASYLFICTRAPQWIHKVLWWCRQSGSACRILFTSAFLLAMNFSTAPLDAN